MINVLRNTVFWSIPMALGLVVVLTGCVVIGIQSLTVIIMNIYDHVLNNGVKNG